MALTDVISSGGYLISQSSDAEAISEPIVQQLIDTDYRKIKEARVHYTLDNISSLSSAVDQLITNTPINIGDELLIKRYDNSIESLIVTSTSPSELASAVPNMLSDTLPAGVCSSSGVDSWYAFDGNENTYIYIGSTNSWIGYQFQDSVPTKIYGYYIKIRSSYPYLYNWKLQYSDNGLDWFDVPGGVVTGDHRTETVNGFYYELLDPNDGVTPLPATHSFFRIWVTQAQSGIYFETLEFATDGILIDTSSVTSGEVPTRAYKAQSELWFNEVQALEDPLSRYSLYGRNGTKLYVISMYPETTFFPSREVITTFKFKAIGDAMHEITSQIYKLNLRQGNDTHTSNTTPTGIGQVSIAGTSTGIVSADAWKVFDGDTSLDAYSIDTDASGNVDFEHVYEFDNQTFIYGIKMTTKNFKSAPSEYVVEGSFDNITYTELLSVSQGVSANDLTITKSFDPALYADYKYYKIKVSKANNLALSGEPGYQKCEAAEYVLLEEDPNA